MKKLIAAAGLVVATAGFPALTLAAQPDNANCWGQVTYQFAQTAPGAMGDHASSQTSPRLGIGNVADAFTDTHQPGTLGVVLGGFLGISCN